MIFASLSFWYRLAFSEIANMPMAAIEVYMDRLEGLQGEMALILAETAIFPWMDSRNQRKALNRWRSSIGIQKIRPTVGQMALIGIRVDYASKSG